MKCLECGGLFTGRKRKFCTRECGDKYNHRKTADAKRERSMLKHGARHCEQCGSEISYGRNWTVAKFCGDECRKAARDPREEKRKHRDNKPKLRMQSHVIAWRKMCKTKAKHQAHVTAWRKYLAENKGLSARYWKSVGMPWRNVHLSERSRYAVRYRLDQEYRLREINRSTWRRDVLNERHDGTINFWQLLRERKTCPYCGERITKKNAVADHMDPLKLGGANSQHNLTICCRSCNTRKSGRPFEEWLSMLPENRRRPALLWYKRKHGNAPNQRTICFTFAA